MAIIILIAGMMFGAVSFGTSAQAPVSNLFVMDSKTGETTQITDTPSYTNQPYFDVAGQRLLYTQAMPNGQMDIWAYHLDEQFHEQITETALTSEYSPTPINLGSAQTPLTDSPEPFTHISTIQVDPQNKQWLWLYSATGQSVGKLFAQEPIGYHAWVNPRLVVVFVLGEPHTLQLITLVQSISLQQISEKPTSGFAAQSLVLDEGIGASIFVTHSTEQSIGHSTDKSSEQYVIYAKGQSLYRFGLTTKHKQLVGKLPLGADYFTLTADNLVVVNDPSNNQLYQYSVTGISTTAAIDSANALATPTAWHNLACPDAMSATRLAIHANRYIAYVCQAR